VVAINELKMRLVAQSCIALGFSTLLNNLLRSVSSSRVRPEPWLRVGGVKSPTSRFKALTCGCGYLVAGIQEGVQSGTLHGFGAA